MEENNQNQTTLENKKNYLTIIFVLQSILFIVYLFLAYYTANHNYSCGDAFNQSRLCWIGFWSLILLIFSSISSIIISILNFKKGISKWLLILAIVSLFFFYLLHQGINL